MLLGLFATDELQNVIGGRDLRDIDEFHVELLAEGGCDFRPSHLAGLDELGDGQRVWVLTIRDRLDGGTGFGHVGQGHQPLVLNELDDVVVGGRHSG